MKRRIGPGDPRYHAVVEKRFNKRYRASPDYVSLARSTEHVVAAVQDAVSDGLRLAVTSGGHCLEGFVSDPEVKVILDVSPMKRIAYDPERRAIAIEGGATVGEAFRTLFDSWGVVVPLGEYPGIGTGGHVAGGAFGFLCRQLGLAADYLYAVEVVTVDGAGRAAVTIATREPDDPNCDLWWAHTGGGAGNFGVVTRHWFRSAEASGDDPGRLLPRDYGREVDRMLLVELERDLDAADPTVPDAPAEVGRAISALRIATPGAIAAGPVLFERLDWRPYNVRAVPPLAAQVPPGEPTRLDPFRGKLAAELVRRLADGGADGDVLEALERFEIALFARGSHRADELRGDDERPLLAVQELGELEGHLGVAHAVLLALGEALVGRVADERVHDLREDAALGVDVRVPRQLVGAVPLVALRLLVEVAETLLHVSVVPRVARVEGGEERLQLLVQAAELVDGVVDRRGHGRVPLGWRLAPS